MLRTTAIAKELATIERKMQETENATLKEALKKKQARLKAELKDPGQSTAKLAKTLLAQREVVKQLSKVEFNDLIRRLSKKPEYSFLKTMPKSTVKNDLEVTAKPVGWRFKGRGNYDKPTKAEIIKGKKNGTVYREVRPRRSDVSQVVRLAEGGGVDSIEPTGYKQNDAVEYGKKLIDADVKYSEVRNKIEEHYAGLRGEIQDVMNKVLDYKESKMKNGGSMYADGGVFMRGGVMGDIYSIEDTEQFKQVITVYNELSEKFGVVNYFLDHNDNSVVFLMEDAEYNKTMDLDRYVNSLHERGFDVLDKTQDLAIKKDNGKNAKYYFKLNLSKKVVYANGGSMYAKGGSLEQESVEMINNQAKSAKHHIEELKEVLSHQKHIEPWVIAKMQRATTDLSDITHYLDGKDPKMAFGGVVYDLSNDAIDRMEGLAPISSMMVFNNNVLEIYKSFEEEGFEKDEISSYLSYKIVEHLNKMMHGGEIKSIKKGDIIKDKYGNEAEVYYADGEKIEAEYKSGATYTYRQKDFDNEEVKFMWSDRNIYAEGGAMYAEGGSIEKYGIKNKTKYWIYNGNNLEMAGTVSILPNNYIQIKDPKGFVYPLSLLEQKYKNLKFEIYEKFARGGYLEGREEYEGYNYKIFYNPKKGMYSVDDEIGIFKGDNNYFEKYDQAKEHAEISISSMLSDKDEMATGGGVYEGDVIFSVDDDELDTLLNANHRSELDYEDIQGDSYYKLNRRDFDRFIDYADSSGFDVDYENSEDAVVYVVNPKMATGGGVDKKITVEVYEGKKITYSNQDIQEMIDNIDMYMASDNLPKWLYVSGKMGKNPIFPKTKEKVIQILEQIKNSKNDVYINVNSKEPYFKHIIKMAEGGFTGDQRKLDVNKNGKIDSEDLSMLRSGKGWKHKMK